ncbi:TPA_asm: coat protein [ssRNA phage SRR6960803_4]|uniref:Coat protein n=1 Tax=ssRNA phage SRR6960803_4 TaxID=2786620 RepID=A0A8S5KZV4_9VIRU|nr:coat protein [ssRNA phage SRR6960803_4]DAD50732.1 TPA_asm: coat protein [ssRNA phage SRR6960803_4]
MSKRTLRLTAYTPGSVQYADPNDIRNTLRVKGSLTPKAVGSATVQNHRGEIIMNETVPVKITDCSTPPVVTCAGDEIISARITLSGSVGNSDALKVLLKNSVENAILAIDAGFLNGFQPPFNTAYEIGLED